MSTCHLRRFHLSHKTNRSNYIYNIFIDRIKDRSHKNDTLDNLIKVFDSQKHINKILSLMDLLLKINNNKNFPFNPI